MVLFGEHYDPKVDQGLVNDYKNADAVVVIGTSLSVYPHKLLPFPPHIPKILINQDYVQMADEYGCQIWTSSLLGKSDAIVTALKERMMDKKRQSAQNHR